MNPLSITNATGAARVAARRSALGLLAGLAFAALMGGTANAQTGTNGSMVLQNITMPKGGVWLGGSLGGHFWQTDQVLGICRVDPAPTLNPPFSLTNCNGTAKSGGQAVVADPAKNALGQNIVPNLPAGAKFVFVPDASSKGIFTVRYVFNPANETLSSPLIMTTPNVTARGGGTNGGRVVGATLAPNKRDLYIGYIKSGDIMMVKDATATTSATPVVPKIGSTSDGRGINSMLVFGNDLYIAEIGGNGLSKIADPSGIGRAPCTEAAQCTAAPLFPQIESFPGGLATDGTVILVGESPVNGVPGRVLSWNPATGALSVFSQNVPAYTSQFDGVTRTQYAGPNGIAFAPNGDVYIADDPTYSLVAAVLPTLQGHLWKVPFVVPPPSVTSISPTNGPTIGGTQVNIVGQGFSTAPGAVTVSFGGILVSATCSTVNACTVLSPAHAAGPVDVQVSVGALTSPIVPTDVFTYIAPPPPGSPIIASIAPTTGASMGGTVVTLTGSGFASKALPPNPQSVTFGGIPASAVNCPTDTTCTVVSPPGAGTVNVVITVDGLSSPFGVTFTYITPVANIWGWGITAPKGGIVFIPGALGGHFWSSDHAQGFCRQDLVATAVTNGLPVPAGNTLHAINYAICDNGTIGSSGQAVYDPRVNPGITNTTSSLFHAAGTHYIYVPDNAVKSTAVWRLTFDPATETIVDAPEAMVPLADTRTLKPNGMVLGPDGNLYVSDLTEMNIRKLTGPNGDPRLQTITIVAVTGDGRGANGTMGVLGNKIYVSENRAASWFDYTLCPQAGGIPCATTPIPLATGAFVAGVATDAVHQLVYISDSPGGANATIWRHNPATGTTSVFLTGGQLPAAGSPNATVWCATTCQRPWDATLVPGGIAGFAFAFGIYNDPVTGDLYITEDATAGARSARGAVFMAPFVP